MFQHSGPGIISPFVDLITKGEGWVHAETWETLTPVYFRTCETLLPLGVPYTFYPSVSIPWRRTPVGKPLATHHDVLARTLIHDVFPVGIWSTQVQGELIPLWRTWEDFGVDAAEWVPYFANDPRVRTTSDDLLASFHTRDGRLLVVVANLTRKSVAAKLLLDRQALGIPAGTLKVKGLLSGRTSSLSGDAVPVEVGPTALAVLRIEG